MKVLSIEQMTRLKELGVDVTPKGMCLMYTSDSSDNYYLKYGESTCEDDVVAFGLQDVIDLLPKVIMKEGLHLYLNISITYSKWYCFEYSFCNGSQFNSFLTRENILDAAYEMLIWVIENGHFAQKMTLFDEEKPPYYTPVIIEYESNEYIAWLAWSETNGYIWTINGTDVWLEHKPNIRWRHINIK